MNKPSLVAALLLSLPALAQPAQSPPGIPSTPPSAPSGGAATGTAPSTSMGAAMNATTFVELASAGDAFEIATSRLAVEKASSAEVKAYAQVMIEEHTRLSEGLRAALRAANAKVDVPLQPAPDAKKRALVDQLRSASEREFDRLYMQAQIQSHEETLAFMQTYAHSGDDPALKRFAAETAPMIEAHLQQARGLQPA